jgi:hypothetical protein
MDIVVHDDVYVQTERDPRIFYEAGIKRHVVITADKQFTKSFPHMAAIALAKTQVIAFAKNKGTSQQKGDALLKVRTDIEKAVREHKGQSFIGVVGIKGSFRVCDESPLPSRKTCEPADWESFERVCKAAGVLALAPKH